MGGAYSLSSIEDTLHPSLQSSLQPNLERRLEFDFHNCSYHSLTEIVVGLKTALGHLVKVSYVLLMIFLIIVQGVLSKMTRRELFVFIIFSDTYTCFYVV